MIKFIKSDLREKPAAILMDLDNTIYPDTVPHDTGLQAVAEKAKTNFSIDEKQFFDLFLEARGNVKQNLGEVPAARNRLLYFHEFLSLIGQGSSIGLALDYEQTYWRNFLREIRPFEGIADFCESARLRGIPLAIVSNLNTQIQFRKILYMGLDDIFDLVCTSVQVGVEKPDPQIFIEAAKGLGCEYSNIWMIGDQIEADMRGAKESLDCRTFLKTNKNRYTKNQLSHVDVTFDSYSELSGLLENFGI